jgi:hypothetical protein
MELLLQMELVKKVGLLPAGKLSARQKEPVKRIESGCQNLPFCLGSR